MRLQRPFFPFLWLLCLAVPAEAVVLDRILAVVNEEIIPLSRVEGYLTFFKNPGQTHEGPYSEQELQSGLQEMINHRLLLGEAGRFGIEEPSEKDIREEVQNIRKRFPSEEAFEQALQRHALFTEDLEEMAKDYLMVNQFIEERIGFFIIVLPDEISQYYAEHREAFGDKSVSEVKNEIEDRLLERKKSERLKLLLAKLRAEARIQVN